MFLCVYMDTIIKTGASIHLRTDDGDNSEKAEQWYQHVRDDAEIHPWSSEDHQLKQKVPRQSNQEPQTLLGRSYHICCHL